MNIRKPIQADSAGRINLGKDCAGLLFVLTHEKNRFVLEPAKVITENEYKSKQAASDRIFLDEEEWEKFEKLMKSNDKPRKELRILMKKKK